MASDLRRLWRRYRRRGELGLWWKAAEASGLFGERDGAALEARIEARRQNSALSREAWIQRHLPRLIEQVQPGPQWMRRFLDCAPRRSKAPVQPPVRAELGPVKLRWFARSRRWRLTLGQRGWLYNGSSEEELAAAVEQVRQACLQLTSGAASKGSAQLVVRRFRSSGRISARLEPPEVYGEVLADAAAVLLAAVDAISKVSDNVDRPDPSQRSPASIARSA